MWKVVGALVVLLLIAGVGYFIVRPTVSPASVTCMSLSNKPVIAAFGDSLVAGYGAESQQGFVGPLSQAAGINIINNGVDGNTTADALARLNDIIAEKPDIVLVLLGGNDALQQVPLQTTQANLQSIISQLQSQHIHVVLIGVLGGFPSDPFKSMFSSLAATNHVLFVPNILGGLITNSKYMYDQVHPNAAGYNLIAEKIQPVLNQACSQFAASQRGS